MLRLPRSARLVAWGNAWLLGAVGVEQVERHVSGADEPHTVELVPGHFSSVGLGEALEELRALGATSLSLALPAPGDPLGLRGPGSFSAAATEATEAVLADGCDVGLVPAAQAFGPPGDLGFLVTWTWHPVTPVVRPTLPSVAEADRSLTEALSLAASRLAQLNVAGATPEVARLVAELRNGRGDAPLPSVYPNRAQALAARAVRLSYLVELAGRDDGGALTSHTALARQHAVQPLDALARRALVAACSAVNEPGGALSAGRG